MMSMSTQEQNNPPPQNQPNTVNERERIRELITNLEQKERENEKKRLRQSSASPAPAGKLFDFDVLNSTPRKTAPPQQAAAHSYEGQQNTASMLDLTMANGGNYDEQGQPAQSHNDYRQPAHYPQEHVGQHSHPDLNGYQNNNFASPPQQDQPTATTNFEQEDFMMNLDDMALNATEMAALDRSEMLAELDNLNAEDLLGSDSFANANDDTLFSFDQSTALDAAASSLLRDLSQAAQSNQAAKPETLPTLDSPEPAPFPFNQAPFPDHIAAPADIPAIREAVPPSPPLQPPMAESLQQEMIVPPIPPPAPAVANRPTSTVAADIPDHVDQTILNYLRHISNFAKQNSSVAQLLNNSVGTDVRAFLTNRLAGGNAIEVDFLLLLDREASRQLFLEAKKAMENNAHAYAENLLQTICLCSTDPSSANSALQVLRNLLPVERQPEYNDLLHLMIQKENLLLSWLDKRSLGGI